MQTTPGFVDFLLAIVTPFSPRQRRLSRKKSSLQIQHKRPFVNNYRRMQRLVWDVCRQVNKWKKITGLTVGVFRYVLLYVFLYVFRYVSRYAIVAFCKVFF
jgi:hypothetical protein